MAQRTGKANNSRVPNATKRLRLGLGIMLTLLLVVGGKLFLVQGLDVGGMAEAALNSRMKQTVLPAERGSILDSRGTVLANSVIRYNVVVDQRVNTKTETFKRLDDAKEKLVDVSREQGLTELAAALGMEKDAIREAVTGQQPYYIVAKDVKPDVEDRISQLQIPGIVTEGVSKRVYPNGSVAGGIIGFLQDGTTGQAGIEQTQDGLLKGADGKRLFEIGADGLRIPVGVDELTPPEDGKDVKLTLNSDLQYFAQQAIQSQTEKLNAEWGSIIVMDAKTGDLVAMADTNAPDPNDPGRVAAKDRGVRSVTAAYEPGSVQKMMTVAALIEEGKAGPLDEFTLDPTYTVNGQTFSDSFHGRAAAEQGTALRLAEEVRHRRSSGHWPARHGLRDTYALAAVGRPAGVHGPVRPGRLPVHAADRACVPVNRQQRRDAAAAPHRLVHLRGWNRGKGCARRTTPDRVGGHRPAGAGHPGERGDGGPDQGRRHRWLPGGGKDRHLGVPLRRRQVRLLRLHRLDRGHGPHG